MKHTRLALVLAITSLTATPVIAASLTMLQFGSFETKEEAEKRLNEVKSKHAAEIGSLGTTIREVKLPPDNLTVYRTQAGPVADRSTAQSICSKLASAGDECYIVQTAMVTAPQTISEAAAATPAPAPAATPATSTLASTSLLADEKKPSDAPDLTSRLSSLKGVPERDASSKAALSSVNSTLGTDEASAPAPAATGAMSQPSPSMQAALDKAAAEQPKAEQSIAESTGNAAQKKSKGFWSHLNPFSSDEPAVEAKAPAVDPKAAPIDTVTTAAVEAPVAVAATAPAPIATPTTVELPPLEPAVVAPKAAVTTTTAAPAPAAAPMVATSAPAPVAAAPMASGPVIMQAEPLRLPPPPAPLKAQDAEKLEAMKNQPATAPVSTGAIAVAPLQPAAGSVNVEEAKRVPVTDMSMPPAQQAAVPVIQHAQPTPPIQPVVSLSPSATEGQKTIWAQVGPFANNDAALAYWTGYRQGHPDFPVVRVRVITPYQMPGQAWLRVGPVTREGFVKNLCASITKESKLRCGTVSDMGMATSLQKPKYGFLTPARYKR